MSMLWKTGSFPRGYLTNDHKRVFRWSRDAGNFANCWGPRIHFIRPMLYNSKSNCWVFATLWNLQESSSLSHTPCTLTRDDRKVRSGKLSMHEGYTHSRLSSKQFNSFVISIQPFQIYPGWGWLGVLTKQSLRHRLRFYSKTRGLST